MSLPRTIHDLSPCFLGLDAARRLADISKYLTDRGHSPATVRNYVRCVEHFERWFATENQLHAGFGEEAIREFLVAHLPKCSCPPPVVTHIHNVRAALNHFLRMLQHQGLIVSNASVPPTPVDREMAAFDEYLIEVCGAALQTRIYRRRYARGFLSSLFGAGPVDICAILPQDVMGYVARQAEVCKAGTVKVIASSLRSYFRFLVLRGACDGRLVGAVPTVPQWRLVSVPKYLEAEEVDALLQTFDLSTATGLRDHAMALLMVHLGLRTQEVAGLILGSIDWRGGYIRVSESKTRRERVLPLPQSVGEAVATYLQGGRPASTSPSLFLRHIISPGTPVTTAIVRGVIRRACARVGIFPPRAGPHALRHTAATRLVRHGVPLPDIADILGHGCIDTTAIYAKVDLPRLAQVTLPWPGVSP
ncbi:tyrosine-type recombinase/integrase [Oligosphaera ethanolica]|uniref:Site-specific recombinase XerD n=1 Tax=Oligosphaera ethanolica TaxID=760260 RepID=A0AAE3VI45_9BACT|nr:site-specific integrase [Oligosphaera ethanolica]MDQ0290569.1 site-specific recombinase XerD [Oligosphaera ethanolica]